MTVTYGVSRWTNSRIRKVGIGSSEHDLTGDDMIIRRTSSVVGRNHDQEHVAVSAMTGAGVFAVSALMLSTLHVTCDLTCIPPTHQQCGQWRQ